MVLSAAGAKAQVSIGSEEGPRNGAVLDLYSTSQGLLLPQVPLETTGEYQLAELSAAEEGMMVYNTNENIAGGTGKGVYVWKSGEWSFLGGGPVYVPVSGITVTTEGGVDRVNSGTPLQLTAEITPSYATNSGVTWSVNPATGGGVNAAGVFTGYNPGPATIRATANDGTGLWGEVQLTVNAIAVPVTAIEITSAGDQISIMAGATLPMYADVQPLTADNRRVTWSIEGAAAVVNASTGVVTGVGVGTVKVIATANDGSGVTDDFDLEVTLAPVSDFTINGDHVIPRNGATTLSVSDFIPSVSDQSVTWEIKSGETSGSITSSNAVSCVVTATNLAGTVVVWATSADGNTIKDFTITVRQLTSPSSFTLNGNYLAYQQSVFSASDFLPEDAEDKTVTYNIIGDKGKIAYQNGTMCVIDADDNTGYVILSANTVGGVTRKDTVLFVDREPGYGEDLVTANATYPVYDFGLPVGQWTLKNMLTTSTVAYPDHEVGERGSYLSHVSACPTDWSFPIAVSSLEYISFLLRHDEVLHSLFLPDVVFGGMCNYQNGTDWNYWDEIAFVGRPTIVTDNRIGFDHSGNVLVIRSAHTAGLMTQRCYKME
ncbi:MAG: Ig-like domain-containing protein [Tannerella sp.]|nr:Ig-like domain-containing protein [Tannerella sp.]